MGKIFKSEADIEQKIIKGLPNSILGTGGFSSVRLVYHKSNPNKFYAMKKLYKKNETEVFYIIKELELHRSLSHPNIVKFYDFLETKTHFYFFLEYAPYGDLFDYVRQNKVTETELLNFFYQVVSAIEYMHSKNIMHRDLKPENILIGKHKKIKVCDFGWSAEYDENDHRKTLCGTYEYMAMEVYLGEKQTKKTDVWSLGVLLYELMHGSAPFRGHSMEQVMEEISKNQIQIRKNLNQDVKDLILSILIVDPQKRPSSFEILSHPALKRFRDLTFDNRKTIQKSNQKMLRTLNYKDRSQESTRNIKKRKFVKSQDLVFQKYKTSQSSSPNKLILNQKSSRLENPQKKKDILKFQPKEELYSEFRNVYNFKTIKKENEKIKEKSMTSPTKTQNKFDKKNINNNSDKSKKNKHKKKTLKNDKNLIKPKLKLFKHPENYKKFFKKKKINLVLKKSQKNFNKQKEQKSTDSKLKRKNNLQKIIPKIPKNQSFSNFKNYSKIFKSKNKNEVQEETKQNYYLNSKFAVATEPEIHIYKNRNFLTRVNQSKNNKNSKNSSLDNKKNRIQTPVKKNQFSLKDFNDQCLTEAKKRSQQIQEKRSLSNKKYSFQTAFNRSSNVSPKFSLNNQKQMHQNLNEIKSIYAQIPQIDQQEKKTLIKKRQMEKQSITSFKRTLKTNDQNKPISRSFSQKLNLNYTISNKNTSISKKTKQSFRITTEDLANYQETQLKLSQRHL